MKKIMYVLIFSVVMNIVASEGIDYDKIVIGIHSPSGFFSIFMGALNKIIWAKKNNKIPVVYWGSSCLYFQSQGYNGSYNVWEYYFEPVSSLKYESGDRMYRIYYAPDGFGIPFSRGCYDNNFHLKLKYYVNEIIRENVKIKPNIVAKIDSFYEKNMKGKKNIGIHLRGTDKKFEAPPVDPTLIFKKANQFAEIYKDEVQFYIATDEERLLDLAKIYLNKNIIYYDSHRAIDNLPIHHSVKDNTAILGEEILIEAQLLSKCDLFIHTRSNVATAVMFFNPEINDIFLGE